MRVFSTLFVCDMILLLSIKEKKLYNFVTCDLHKESALNTGTCRIQFTIKMYEKT